MQPYRQVSPFKSDTQNSQSTSPVHQSTYIALYLNTVYISDSYLIGFDMASRRKRLIYKDQWRTNHEKACRLHWADLQREGLEHKSATSITILIVLYQTVVIQWQHALSLSLSQYIYPYCFASMLFVCFFSNWPQSEILVSFACCSWCCSLELMLGCMSRNFTDFCINGTQNQKSPRKCRLIPIPVKIWTGVDPCSLIIKMNESSFVV